MKRLALALCLFTGLIPVRVCAEAILRPNVMVDGDVVTIGDLFDNVGDKADKVAARAPAPGRSDTWDADRLHRIAAINGVDWHSDDAFAQTVIVRNCSLIAPERIIGELQQALVAQGVAAASQLELDGRLVPPVIPVGVDPDIRIRDLFYDGQSSHFRASLEIQVPGTSSSRLTVTGRVVPTIDVPVAVHTLTHGEIIKAEDLTWRRIRQESMRRDMLTDIDQLIGMTPHTTLRANQLVSTTEIERPVAVARGALVTMVLKAGAMSLSAQGRAVDQGSIGDVIRVTNTHSNVVVQATVDGPNLVHVSLTSGVALAN